MKFHPSCYIKEFMQEKNISEIEMAYQLDMDLEPFMNFINGNMKVDIDLANKLAVAMNTSVDLWLNLQNKYSDD